MTSLHTPLISSLTTLYTLLVDLRYVPSSALIIPTPCHPHNSINRIAAIQNGFSEAAVNLAYQIPYVTEDDYQLNYGSRPLCYLARLPEAGEAQEDDRKQREGQDPLVEGPGEYEWEYARDPTCQERDYLWTGHDVLVLTHGQVYGKELIYDLEKQTITEWQHFEVEEWRDLPAFPMTSPQNPLYVWIRNLLTLENIPLSNRLLIPYEPEAYGYPGENADEEELVQWRQRVEDGKRERGLKHVYVECGWKIDTVEGLECLDGQMAIWDALEQARQRAGKDFRGDEFEQRREEWENSLRTSIICYTFLSDDDLTIRGQPSAKRLSFPKPR